MFKLVSLPPKGSAGVCVRFSGNELNFAIGSVLTKRNKEDMDGEKQYSLLNGYATYKGDSFKEELYVRYQQAFNDILYSSIDKDERTLPYNIVHPIIDMFDITDIFNWLKHVRKIVPPSILAETFDPMIEADERGSRVQTYLKDDFIELAALTVIIKAAMLPIAHFGQYNSSIVNNKLMAYVLFDFIKSHRIYNVAPMQKLLGMVEKMISLPTNTPEAQAIRVIEKMIAKDEIPTFILASAVILRVSTATIVDDDADGNLITKIYKYINTKLKETIDTAKAIREKVPITTDDGVGGADQESFIEAFRMSTSVSAGIEVEMDDAVSSIENILMAMPKQMKQYIDPVVLNDSLVFSKKFVNCNIDANNINLLGIIFKSVIDPRSMHYISLESTINLIAVGFAYLWGLGHKPLALLLASQPGENSGEVHSLNFTSNFTRVSPQTREKLVELFPYQRPQNEITFVNLAEEWINAYTNNLNKRIWVPIPDEHYVTEVLGDSNYSLIIPSDIKVQLADFIIKHEENNCAI